MNTTQTKALTDKAINIQTEQIRKLNDNLRRNIFDPLCPQGSIFLTAAVSALKHEDQIELLKEVCCFEDFNEDNDPYGEHDFGAIDFKGEKYFFKIDYYDRNYQGHTQDASDPKLTNRVMTIMRADEY